MLPSASSRLICTVRSMPSAAAVSSLNRVGAATVTEDAPPLAISCASSSPVGPAPKTSALAPGRTSRRLQAVHGAGGGLGEHRGVLGQALDREDQVLRDGDVLGEEAREVAAQPLRFVAQDQPAGQAVVAVAAVDVRVDRDLLADPEPGHPVAHAGRPPRPARARESAGRPR